MLSLDQIKNFLLEIDAVHNTQMEVWVGNTKITQANGSNPRCVQMSPKEIALTPGLEAVSFAWKCRVVQSESLRSVVQSGVKWQLRPVGRPSISGLTVLPPIVDFCRSAAWIVTLVRTA